MLPFILGAIFFISMKRIGLGICSHRFLSIGSTKPCVIAGITFDDIPGFQHYSDGDVVFFSLCHAITTLTGIEVIGVIAKNLYNVDGITDSEVYLKEALRLLNNQKISHVSISLEAKKPHFHNHIPKMRQNLARILNISESEIGISAISGDGLSDVSCGDGVRCTAIVSTESLETYA